MTVFELIKRISKLTFDGQEQVLLTLKIASKQKDGTIIEKDCIGILEDIYLTYPEGEAQQAMPKPLITLEATELE